MVDLKNDATSISRQIHGTLNHPVIDGDGHWLESYPIFLDYLRDVAGASMVADYVKRSTRWKETSESPPWPYSTNALDRATVSLPALLHERLEAFGIDFSVVYPTMGLRFSDTTPDAADLRRALCRAHNKMSAEMFADYSDRMTPVAVLPMLTPEEAIDEVQYVVNELRLKVVVIAGTIQRAIASLPESANPVAHFAAIGSPSTYVDNLVLDPVYDYDPLWQKFVDLNLAVTTHAGSMGWPDRRSQTNGCFNHTGHFAQANHTFARALFFSGVTYRYPTLKFAFLEGGVGWACNLLCSLFEENARAGREALATRVPTLLDTDELQRLYEEYGGKWLSHRAREQLDYLETHFPGMDIATNTERGLAAHDGDIWDDFAAAHTSTKNEIRERFTKNFYFGCEADDPMTAAAFDPRLKTGLKPIFGSDIAHPDVPVLTAVLHEAHELVDDGLITDQDFKDFAFGNIAELHGGMNPNFFKGTVVEDAVAAHLDQLQ